MNKRCLNCKYYKIQDASTGLCRIEALTSGNQDAKKPRVEADNTCDNWVDCGQTYYIRLGWIKNLGKEEEGTGKRALPS